MPVETGNLGYRDRRSLKGTARSVGYPKFHPGKKGVVFFSRGRGRGHAIPDAQIAEELSKLRTDIEVRFASYGTGAATLIELGYEVIDLKLPEQSPVNKTLIRTLFRTARVMYSLKPRLVVSHEEFGAVTAAKLFDTPTLFITDWFVEPWQASMELIKFAKEILFMDEAGVFGEPEYLKGKVTYVGPVLPRFTYTRGEREQAREELGIPRNATVVSVLVYPGRRSEEFAPLYELLMPAFEMLDENDKFLVWNTSGDYDLLLEKTRDFGNVSVLNEDLRTNQLMVASDVAITKGNRNIVVELAALGIPSVTLAYGLNRIDDFRTAKLESNVTVTHSDLNAGQLAGHLRDALSRGETLKPHFSQFTGEQNAAVTIARRIAEWVDHTPQ